jgi:hypothetical protein
LVLWFWFVLGVVDWASGSRIGCCWWVSVVVARGGGQGLCLPVMLPGGAVEARGSGVLRKRHRASDAEGALDLGGTAPQAARYHHRHPPTAAGCP